MILRWCGNLKNVFILKFVGVLLPKVYNPKAKPWIQPDNASTEELIAQIDKCPSGALTYKQQNATPKTSAEATTCTVLENGPLLVNGTLEITLTDGTKETKKRSTAFCRCGASQNKPYCDGAHKEIDFKG